MKTSTLIIALSMIATMALTAYAIVSADEPITDETLEVIKSVESRQDVKPQIDEQAAEETVIVDEKIIEEVLASEKPYVPTYSDDDLYCLACVIYAEAGADYCTDELRMAVGNVVLNRVLSELYPNSIRKVIEQPMQYGWLSRNDILFPTNAAQHAIDRAYDCARRLLGGERPLPSNVIYQAEFAQGKELYGMINGVYFCR